MNNPVEGEGLKIGKLERLPYPSGLLVDIHSYCNASCRICPYSKLSKVNPMGFMSWNLYTKILDDYRQLMDRYNFTGVLGYCQMGEPFILKDIARWVKYAMDNNIRVYFNTNASLLFPNIVDSLADMGFNGFFNISFHGINRKTYESIMHLDYDQSMNNIEYLLKRFSPSNIRINAVCFGWGAGEEGEIRLFWQSKGVSAIISKVQSRSGLVSEVKKVSKRRIAGCRTERICYEMVISFTGDVLLCCNDMAREVIIGNLNTASIEEVWNGNQFARILKNIHNNKNLPSNFICKRCEESEDYWSARRIVKRIMPARILRAIQSAKEKETGWIVKQNWGS